MLTPVANVPPVSVGPASVGPVTVHTRPEITRPDAGLVVVTEFQVGGADQQQALFAASRATWETLPWPDTLLSIAWLASTDGQRALAYVQWRDDSEFETYARTHRPVIAARLKAALPHVETTPPVFYRRYRSGTRPDAPEPGCIVAVSVEFDGPDEARQRAWIDSVFQAIEAEPSPPAGGIAAHFHVSTDGRRVLNYAEWIDEASHVAALERSGIGAVGSGPRWRAVQTFPGLKGSRVTRYRLDRRFVPPSPGARS
ncbi:MAG: antibiotic biosynthesis monooxygenase [Vicinamibacteraceae bacterium]